MFCSLRSFNFLDEFLRYVEALDFPDDIALHYAQIRASLKLGGNMIGANNLFIAAHAQALGLTIVTNDTREFGRIADLKVENRALPSLNLCLPTHASFLARLGA
jgi:tRNA(fMet)-specific endonuclease VapC